MSLSYRLLLLVVFGEQLLLPVFCFKVQTGASVSAISAAPCFASGSCKPGSKSAVASSHLSAPVRPGLRHAASSFSVALPGASMTETGMHSEVVPQTASSIAASPAAGATSEDEEAVSTSANAVVTRKDLVASVAAELQVPQKDVERTVNTLLRHISNSLEQGNKVAISKFGTFGLRRRGERTARNPRTGEPLNVPASTFPTFSFSKVLKEKVREVMPVHQEESDEEPIEEKKKGLFSWS
ncbi:histone family DNA-binding protein [Besnoitia besnoiti]|uniref:Histone family DNA-binding protein n=1 Tax=Besnoitia besnoiti TaxID=94643 RepID=A0A2A9MHX9_BESBE|nr:histone family DNA-binding protein [Besnoitia besnoiti]PFH35010.1 histone family DNA-binding protein [Besnoitia besnoiti]